MNQSTDDTIATPPTRRFQLDSPLSTRALAFLLGLATVIVAAMPIARFVATALARIGYPFDLEWVEGGTLGHIRVVLAGQQIYREPSLDFTPHLYPPLYYYVSALPSLFLGAGHLAPRLVSFVSILGAFVLLGRWVRNETDDPVAGVAAVGVLASTYQITGYWFELARVDALFLLLVLSSHTLARTAKTPLRAGLVGVLIAAAIFTKQLGIPLAVPALLLLLLRSFRLALIAGLVSGALVALTTIVLSVSSHGWFLYYVLFLPSRHPMEWSRFWVSVNQLFLSTTFPMTLAGMLILCGLGFAPHAWKRWLFHAVFIVLAVTTSFLPYLKSGGYPNGLIPAYAALALASGLALAALRRARLAPLGTVGPRIFVCAVLALQFKVLDYDPQAALPSKEDLEANQTVIERLTRMPKPLFCTGSSFYSMASGDAPIMSDTAGLSDVFKGGGPQAENLRVAFTQAIQQHRFKTIILDRAAGFLPQSLVQLIQQNYVYRGTVLHGLPPDVLWQKSGASLRPDTVWVPR